MKSPSSFSANYPPFAAAVIARYASSGCAVAPSGVVDRVDPVPLPGRPSIVSNSSAERLLAVPLEPCDSILSVLLRWASLIARLQHTTFTVLFKVLTENLFKMANYSEVLYFYMYTR